jgi:hypothetical protein
MECQHVVAFESSRIISMPLSPIMLVAALALLKSDGRHDLGTDHT